MDLLIGLMLALFAGVVPMLAYAMVVWWFDRYEAEPLPLLAATFLWGAVPSIVLALVLELVFDIPIRGWVETETMAYQLIGSSVIAPVVEEVLKAAAVLGVFLFFYREFDSILDGIIYGSLVGFGFAAVENVFYFLSALGEGGLGGMLGLIVLRAFVFGLNHAFFTSLTGIGFAVARMSRSCLLKLVAPVTGLVLAISAHAIHNGGMTLAESSCLLPLFSVVVDWGGALVVFVIILLAAGQEKRWLQSQLPEEVKLGILTQAECKVVCSYTERLAQRTGVFFSGDFGRWWRLEQFYQLATDLAFKKHQLANLGDEGGNRAVIERLRRRLVAMRR
ncbi:MAG: PrsW family intramembrane metalloprotease [Thermoflexales bacterium]|nr:PrsW family intramembrane metalloprotease [Thermoflexales bacterium]